RSGETSAASSPSPKSCAEPLERRKFAPHDKPSSAREEPPRAARMGSASISRAEKAVSHDRAARRTSAREIEAESVQESPYAVPHAFEDPSRLFGSRVGVRRVRGR